jgi:hypothetical protein
MLAKKTLSFTVKAIHASMGTIEYQKQHISLSFHLSCHSFSSLALREFECKARSRLILHLPVHRLVCFLGYLHEMGSTSGIYHIQVLQVSQRPPGSIQHVIRSIGYSS